MRLSFAANDVDALFAELGQKIGSCMQINPTETMLNFSPHLGEGYLQRIKLSSGLQISIGHFEVPEPFIAEVSSNLDRKVVEFQAFLSGQVKGGFLGLKDEYHVVPRQSKVSFRANRGEWIECQPCQSVIYVEVVVDISVLSELIAEQFEQLTEEFQVTLKGRATDPLAITWEMSHATFQAAEQTLNCPYQGLTRRLYLESRALELIALQLPLRSSDNYSNSSHRSLKSDDVERIHYAREILLKNFENPPSLIELAQKAGLNDYKLKQGFRQVFGTTAFGCLHHYRMEQARILLEASCSTVTEVAQTVGYSSATSFSSAFKKKFGMSPMSYKLRS